MGARQAVQKRQCTDKMFQIDIKNSPLEAVDPIP
jgi:hypothetical protein